MLASILYNSSIILTKLVSYYSQYYAGILGSGLANNMFELVGHFEMIINGSYFQLLAKCVEASRQFSMHICIATVFVVCSHKVNVAISACINFPMIMIKYWNQLRSQPGNKHVTLI